jgi:osmotically-inducible protein OsmY
VTVSLKGLKNIGFSIVTLSALAACTQPVETQAGAPVTIPSATTPANNTTGTVPSPGAAANVNVDDAAERVDRELDKHPTLGVFDLDADDDNNTIVLEGRVQNEEQRTLAETVAQQIAPGVPIVNRIAL